MTGPLEIIICTSDEIRCAKNLAQILSHCTTEPSVTVIGDECQLDRFCLEPLADELGERLTVWGSTSRHGPVACLERGYILSTAPYLAYIHDDVEIYEPGWDATVLAEFDRGGVGVVGFGGAIGLGTDDIYQTPYRLQQLARIGYASNVTDWKTHGGWFNGSRRVATIDGFAMIVARTLLDQMGGWPARHLMFHMYDAAICCYAARHGMTVRQAGISCRHFGGQTSVKDRRYSDWLQAKFGKTDSDVHRDAHEWFYSEFEDVLPARA